ncbi:MAG TPA: hypothetical protein VFP22_04820 [Candidatus Limnocylindrales bacterium]|nr:hypothetical protein [Candidatus Limnocylindrales bacterium]
MDRERSITTLIGTALLGVLAVAALVAGVFILFGGWVIWRGAGTVDDVATVAAVLTGLLTIGLGVVAGFAAHEEWLGRPRGRMLGIVVALVALLAAVVPLVTGRTSGNDELFYLAAGLAVLTAIPLLVPEHGPRSTSAG